MKKSSAAAAALLTAVGCSIVSGQTTCSQGQLPETPVVYIRGEGQTELVSDYVFHCNNTSPSPADATVTVSLSPPGGGTAIPITSMVLPNGTMEASLVVFSGSVGFYPPDSPGSNSVVTAQIQGIIVNGAMTFYNVPIPPRGQCALYITNVRADVTQSGASQVYENVSVSGGADIQNVTFPGQLVALVYGGLGLFNITGVADFVVPSQPGFSTLSTPQLAFTVKFGESSDLPYAFKIQGNAVLNSRYLQWMPYWFPSANYPSKGFASAYGYVNGPLPSVYNLPSNTETGTYFPALNNLATSGTRVRILFGNVPQTTIPYPLGANLLVPVTLNSDQVTGFGGTPLGTMRLTASEAGPFSAIAPPSGNAFAEANNLAPITVDQNGNAEAVYEVTQENPLVTETYALPVYLQGSIFPNGSISVGASLAPVAATSNVPDFIGYSGAFSGTISGSAVAYDFGSTVGSLPDAVTGRSYSATIPLAGGTPPYIWDFSNFTFPDGLGFSVANNSAVINGTPSGNPNPGYGINGGGVINVHDSTPIAPSSPNGQLRYSLSVGIQVHTAQAFAYSCCPASSGFRAGEVGVAYSSGTLFYGSGGIPPLTYSLGQGSLPPGLAVDFNTLSIGGTPTAAGTYNFSLTLTDATQTTVDSTSLTGAPTSIVIFPPAQIPLGTPQVVPFLPDGQTLALPSGFVGIGYLQTTIYATGGVPPYAWFLFNAPSGLGINPNTGQISGTPNGLSGTYTATIQIVDSLGGIATRNAQIVIGLTPYQLTTSASPAAGGTLSPPSGGYSAGSVLTVTATPNPGYVFANFSGALTGTQNPQNLTLNQSAQVVANFTRVAPAIAASAGARTVGAGSAVAMTLTLTNTGLGAATNATITGMTATTVAGTGTVTVASMNPPDLGAINPSSSASTSVTLNWPATATRVSFVVNYTADGGYSGANTITILR